MNSYKELIVWQKSVDFCEKIYFTSKKFPKEEIYGLTSQIRRASVAIPSNIAEGHKRHGKNEYTQFLSLTNQLEEIMKMLNKLIFKISHLP